MVRRSASSMSIRGYHHDVKPVSPAQKIKSSKKSNSPSASNVSKTLAKSMETLSPVVDNVDKQVTVQLELVKSMETLSPVVDNVDNQVAVQIEPAGEDSSLAGTSEAHATTEEGEIVPTSPVTTTNSAEEGEWLKVSGSRGKNSSKNSTENLKYGQVRILTQTRFDALRDHAEEESAGNNMVNEAHHGTNQEKEVKKRRENEGTASRPVLPRNSKTGHKFLADSSQKAQDSVPSNINKKVSKPKR